MISPRLHAPLAAVLFGFVLGMPSASFAQQAPADKPAPGSPAPDSPLPPVAPLPSDSTALPLPLDTRPLPPPAPPILEAPPAPPAPKKEDHWYDRLHIRGYTQFRYNRLPSFDQNDNLVNDQGDRSIGAGNGFSIRRARVILFGDVHERVFVYLQPDFASVIGTQLNVAIMRDWYADLFIDSQKELRIRVGQSKVPFGFENMQSSQNRVAFDRNDAINSGVKDERDIGAFVYWAPTEIRKRFKHFIDAGLKGSGDYGVVGVGVYNGQSANRLERNDTRHVVARLTWPFKLGEQFVELGVAGYYGKYVVTTAPVGGTNYTLVDGEANILDERAVASFVLYPQPLGIAAEYNIGRGPAQGENQKTVIGARKLNGGYVQAMLKLDNVAGTTLIPYARYTYYDGGKKFEDNAPHYIVKELEMGVEWQLLKALEVTAAYMISDRTSSRFDYKQEKGHVTRLQVQVNY